MLGKHLDLSNDHVAASEERGKEAVFLGVMFACCRVYCRIYKNAQGTAYTGHCPRCLRSVTIKISAEGTSERFFTVQ